ncbi:MAG: type IV secretory system conjugative DNA transfer family protein, partial [Actinomycetota bacterium]|nr:type IV secretory system conjugative DNA transfer family protein [Actinomycetota bacterium]
AGPTQGSGGAAFLVIAAALLGVVWLGAQAAALVTSHHLGAGLGPSVHALVRLPAHSDDPRLAWGDPWAQALPGPGVYWACTALTGALGVVALAFAMRLFAKSGVGTDERKRLGVDTKARLAVPRDLRPLVVRHPIPGRLIVGRVQGRLVATELRDPAKPPKPGSRFGDRSAVAMIGPTRCGKSADIISAILEWEGPAILSSVRGDLLEATIARRRCLGGGETKDRIKIFDPTEVVRGHKRAQWSPVAHCDTVGGAKKLAHALASANPQNLPHDGYFSTMAEELLWPLLFTAVVSKATMGHVVHWVLSELSSIDDITERLDDSLSGPDPRRRHAQLAMRLLRSLWDKEPRTRASIYTTALTMIANWEDPVVADAAVRSEITMEWLVGGPNTLYVCSPLHEQLRLATVFGGILDDLLQQSYEWYNTHGSRLPDVLLVLDEAANTPARWLPQVASTCSGIGIQLVTIWQSKAQIDHAYGTLADSVLTNHGTKVFFSGISDPSTLDYVSRLLGDEEVVQRGASADVGLGRRSVNESATRLRLVPSDILRQAPPGEGLLIHGTLRPAHLKGRFYYADRGLRRLAGEEAVTAAARALAAPPPAGSPIASENAPHVGETVAVQTDPEAGPRSDTTASGLTITQEGGLTSTADNP